MKIQKLRWLLTWVCVVLCAGQAHGQSTELRPSITDTNVSTPLPLTTIHGPILQGPVTIEKFSADAPTVAKSHYIGFGLQRSKELITFPVLHPVSAFNKGTFPLRHPLAAFKTFGELVEPYQPAMNFLSAASGPVTSAGVFTINKR